MSKGIYNENDKIVGCPPYKCKLCTIGDIKHEHEVCAVCGWEDDEIQFTNPDFVGGGNYMSYNQYKKFWEENKKRLLENKSCLFAIELAEEYYNKNFKELNEDIINRELNGEIIQDLK